MKQFLLIPNRTTSVVSIRYTSNDLSVYMQTSMPTVNTVSFFKWRFNIRQEVLLNFADFSARILRV